jgi:hypothetical protein
VVSLRSVLILERQTFLLSNLSHSVYYNFPPEKRPYNASESLDVGWLESDQYQSAMESICLTLFSG